VVQELANAGFPRDDISIIANNASGELSTYSDEGVADGAVTGATGGAVLGGVAGLLVGLGALTIPGVGPIIAAGPLAAALAGAGIGAAAGGLLGALVDLGIPDEEAGYYAEGVRRGGALVSVRADDDMADTAVTIMERYNPVDVESRAEEWRQSGWTGYDENAGAYTGGNLGSAGQGSGTGATQSTGATSTGYNSGDVGTTQTRELNEGQVAIPVVEEDIRIGKREVERGGVRVRSYVQEIPVEEQVNLRQERVVVERRPVDRPVTDADLTNFQQGTIELTETAEEAVVQKQARVVEEIVVGKEVEERVETIRDTVRRTDVDVEEVGTTRATGTSGTGGTNV